MSRRCPEPRWFVGDPTSLACDNTYTSALTPCERLVNGVAKLSLSISTHIINMENNDMGLLALHKLLVYV